MALVIAIGSGWRITQWANRYQPPRSSGRAARSAARCQRGRRERVHVRAEQSKERRQHGQCDDAGERRDDQPAQGHRTQEAEREHEQRRESSSDRDRAEGDRAPGRLEGRAQRLDPGTVPDELLPVARDEQQAVVDREAETCARDEVEREDRDRGHVVDHSDQCQRDHDREAAGNQRQRSGDDAAKHPQSEQEEQWERDQLRAQEVVLRLGAHLLVRDGGSSDLAWEGRGEALRQRGVVAGTGVERRGDQHEPPVR